MTNDNWPAPQQPQEGADDADLKSEVVDDEHYVGPNPETVSREKRSMRPWLGVFLILGLVVAGVLWQSSGWAFAAFIASSSNYAAIYSSFAILILLLMLLMISLKLTNFVVNNSATFFGSSGSLVFSLSFVMLTSIRSGSRHTRSAGSREFSAHDLISFDCSTIAKSQP